jgi:flagellar M-ring protein FliF
MPGAVSGLLGRVRGTYRQFTLPQRTLVIIGVAVLALGTTALLSWVGKPTMSPVFTDLTPADASAVVDELEARGVPYELTAGGTTVLVPEDQLYDLRIALAADGVPSSEDGYSLLDDMGMTTSDFQQHVTYQRALEGELARTIEAMDGVRAATVHLAIPEESVFVEEAGAPTASVFVELETGASLDADAVQAIVNLVSSAIPGMEPTGVSVIDADGQVLTDGTGAGGTSSEYEDGVTARVQAMLDRVVGPGNAVVTVQAELSRDQTQRTSETYTPAEGVPPLSSSTTTEEYSGTGTAVGGVLGPDNIAVPDNTDGAGTYSSEQEVLNNTVNKVTEQTAVGPGGVSRQSVSVVVDSQAGAGVSLTELERMIGAAAGIDPSRGDQVAVTRMAFDTSAADRAAEAIEAADKAAAADRQSELIRQGIVAGVALVVLAVVLVVARAARKARRETRDNGRLELVAAQQEAALPAGVAAAAPTLPGVAAPAAIGPADAQAETARAEIAALAAEDPAVVAARLREWLAVRS